jgi:hypothetical protein
LTKKYSITLDFKALTVVILQNGCKNLFSLIGKLFMDIVITGQQAWDVEIGSNCKNIALEFSKQHRVLYVNSPLDRIQPVQKWQ